VGHSQFPRALVSGQPSRSRRWHPGCHRCLLKGCEGWFLPRRPQARYCSPACQKAASSWRRWHSCQRFKATDHGKKVRRVQARRYRIRLRQRSSLTQPTPTDDVFELTSPVIEPLTSLVIEPLTSPVIEPLTSLVIEPLTSPVVEPLTSPGSEPPPIVTTTSEGQRPAKICEDSRGLPCHRPGCYVLFLRSARSPDQKFCSDSCRQALRRVRQREFRLRKRRRRGVLPRYVHHREPPEHPHLTSSCMENVIL
jgi:predicted nucleic acid-binding Zn ribbon protein